MDPHSLSTSPHPPLHVALFVTCLTDQFYPRVGVAIVKVLERLGCEVVFPPGQTCCGQPMYNNGFHAEAADLARRFIEVFEPYDYIVTPSASCCAMVRQHYPALLGSDPAWSKGAQRVAWRCFEFVEFLDRVLSADLRGLKLPSPTTVTYHYSCHQRGLGMRDEAVRLLRQIGNLTIVPLEKAEECCGFGGAFSVKFPEISGSTVREKVRCIAATGAPVAVSNEAGCTMNIAGTCRREGVGTRIAHAAEIIAQAMGLDVEGW